MQRVLLNCMQRWKTRLLEVCELLRRDAVGVELAFHAHIDNSSGGKRRIGHRVMPQTVDEVRASVPCVRARARACP